MLQYEWVQVCLFLLGIFGGVIVGGILGLIAGKILIFFAELMGF